MVKRGWSLEPALRTTAQGRSTAWTEEQEKANEAPLPAARTVTATSSLRTGNAHEVKTVLSFTTPAEPQAALRGVHLEKEKEKGTDHRSVALRHPERRTSNRASSLSKENAKKGSNAITGIRRNVYSSQKANAKPATNVSLYTIKRLHLPV